MMKTILIALLLTPAYLLAQHSMDAPPSGGWPPPQEKKLNLLATIGPKEQMGAWVVPELPPEADRMQAIHAILLPSGKILIVNGSSLRFPFPPMSGKIDPKDPEATNNTAIFDPNGPPQNSGFKRIASPANPVKDDANDLFCGGHLHTPNGNVLFTGGTRTYIPRIWTGSRFGNLFDWRTETWKDADWIGESMLQDGHWYPTLFAMPSGKIGSISGLTLKEFEGNSSWVEFYDPKFPVDRAWTAVDIRGIENGPFINDSPDHYPRMHRLPDGRFMITGDGSGGGRVDSKRTYLMTVKPCSSEEGAPDITFEHGPDRIGPRRVYGTITPDPNIPGSFMLMGGILGDESHLTGPFLAPKNLQNAVTADMERYWPPDEENPLGRWELIPDFLGDRPEDKLINHYGLILPNKQILVIGGGNYVTYRPQFQPSLLTYEPSAPGGYIRSRMNPGTQPRLYHCSALLLPDGRVFVGGGNASMAARQTMPDGSVNILLNTTLAPPYGIPSMVPKGSFRIPAEIHQVEFFYPPYLFIKGPRPKIQKAPESINYGKEYKIKVDHMTSTASLALMKLGSSTHGADVGQAYVDLKFSQNLKKGEVSFTAPSDNNAALPGYYMLFYVNAKGQPGIAPIIKVSGSN